MKRRFVPCPIGEQSRFPDDYSREIYRAPSVAVCRAAVNFKPCLHCSDTDATPHDGHWFAAQWHPQPEFHYHQSHAVSPRSTASRGSQRADQFSHLSEPGTTKRGERAVSAASDSEKPTDPDAAPVQPGERFKFDVFISHSSTDKTLADAVCHTLEANGLRCWIAPRDIEPGSEWSEGIFQGIDSSRTFVLVFTNHANESKHVLREVGRAFSKNSVVIPFRAEDIKPSRGLEYWISQSHWLDAMTPPLQQHLDRLVQVVRKNLDLPPTKRPESDASVHVERTPTSVPPGPGGPLPAQSATARPRPLNSTTAQPQQRAVREGVKKGSDSTRASQPKSASPPPPPARGPLPLSIPGWIMWAGGTALLLLGIVLIFQDGPPTPAPASGGRESAESLTGTQPGDTREITLPGGVTLKQVWCPPGTFTMGSRASVTRSDKEDKGVKMIGDLLAVLEPSETGRAEDEDDTAGAGGKPVQVTLTKGYWLAATETTQGQWTAVMGAASKPWSGKTNVKEGPNFPASYISHGVNADGTIEADSATAFCEKLTEIERQAGRLPTGWKYALPTEAQWEYACRAGTTTPYSFKGDESQLGHYAWFAKNAWDIGEKYAHEVGTKTANPWGLYDMHGNLWEWCRDRYGGKLVGGTNPAGPPTGSDRVDLGGGWFNPAGYSRSACRGRNVPSVRQTILGFRLCLSSD